MLVKTKPFGEIEVDERQKVSFPSGIFGFENLRNYVLLDAAQPPFYWLQSVDEREISFVLIDPTFFRPDYVLEAPDEDLEEIGAKDTSDLLIFAIVTIPHDQERMSANLQGPIVIHRKNKTAKQTISLNSKWKVRHYILDEMAAVKDRAC